MAAQVERITKVSIDGGGVVDIDTSKKVEVEPDIVSKIEYSIHNYNILMRDNEEDEDTFIGEPFMDKKDMDYYKYWTDFCCCGASNGSIFCCTFFGPMILGIPPLGYFRQQRIRGGSGQLYWID